MIRKRPGLQARSDAVKAAAMVAGHEVETAPMAEEASAPSPANAPPERVKPVVLSVRLPPDVHEALRTIAFEHRVSIHALLMEGVDSVLKKYGKER